VEKQECSLGRGHEAAAEAAPQGGTEAWGAKGMPRIARGIRAVLLEGHGVPPWTFLG